MPLAGKMVFVSQSGAICTAILDLSIEENIGFSYFVSLGDMLGDPPPEAYGLKTWIRLSFRKSSM